MEGDNASGFGVNLIAYIRAEMGLGTSARGVAHALEAANVPFNILNFEHSNPALHRDESWTHKVVKSSSYDFTLFAINPDNISNARTRVQKRFVKDRYTIGYWFWELPEIPDNWQASFSLVDEVWAASHFVQDAISLKSPVPVFRVPVPVRLGPTDRFSRQTFSLPENRFLFLSMSDAHSHLARKNPLGMVRAFKQAFPDEDKSAGLILKINNVNTADSKAEAMEAIWREINGQENIYVLDAEMTRPEIDSLLAVSDCFVSLHRSEGFGLGPAEAMSLGKPAILTKWSGNTDYMTPTNSIGIDYQLIPVGKQLGPYEPHQFWADPDLDQASFWMRRLVEDPEFAKKTGLLGQETIRQQFSPEAVGRIIHDRLTYLHRSGALRRTGRANSNLNTVAHLQTFAAREGTPDAQQSNTVEVAPGQWSRLKIELPWGLGDGSVPFRFDPVDRTGIVDLAAVTLRATATGDILWRAHKRSGLDQLTVRGTALRLPHDRLLRFLSYDDDPQVYLPHLTGDRFGEPLTLEILLRFDPAPKNVERAVSDWNELAVTSSHLPLHGEAASLLPVASSDTVSVPGDPDDQITMIVYSADESGYSEERSTHVTYTRDHWSHLDIALQLGLGSGPLRLDPLTAMGLIDIAALTIRSAISNEVLWRANGGGDLETVHISGSAVRIPHPHLVRVLSYGDDPQIYLPNFPGGKFDGPLRLEVWLKTEMGLDPIRRGISELASLSAAAAATTSQTRALLEQSSHAISDKEVESETLRAKLEEAARERMGLEETVDSLRSGLDETRKQLASVKSELSSRMKELDESQNDLRNQVIETKNQSRQVERFRQELKMGTSHSDWLSHDISLLKKQLVAENITKVDLIKEFIRSEEKIRSLKRDLALVREALSRKHGSLIQRLLGGRSLEKTPGLPDIESQVPSVPSEYRFWLDSPAGPSAGGERVFFAGWVLSPPEGKVLGIRAVVQGDAFLGQYGFERSDVAATFSDRPDAAHPGFSVGIPLAMGVHEVALQALDATGKWVTFCSHQHEVIADASPQGVADLAGDGQIAVGQSFQGTLEDPGDETIVESGLMLIKGWLTFGTEKIVELFVRIGDGMKVSLAHSLQRDDVAAYLPDNPSARYSGFEGYIPVALDYAGYLELTIEAILADDAKMVCFQRDVLVRPPDLRNATAPLLELSDDERYARWMETNRLTPYLRKRMASDGNRLAKTGPLISILVPTFNTRASYLEALIESVRGQLYPNWQLCLADDASTQPHVRSILERWATADSRIQVLFRETNGHIVKASNSALTLAKGEYVGLLDHDDLLSADALLHIAEAVVADGSLDLLYTDEDKLSPEGDRYDPIFKGSFSPEMSLTHNYIQHFTVIRRSLVHEAGGFREGFEGAQDLDLYLRILEKTRPERVRHIPFVCYHWRSHPESTASSGAQKTYVFDSARASIAENLRRRHLRAVPFLPEWAKESNCCLYQLEWSPDLLKENPVTIVIPTKNRGDLLRKCLASLERTVDGANVNVIIVDDFSEEESTRDYLKQLGSGGSLPCRVIQPRSRPEQFNFSQLINEGVAAATTPLVLLLNNDTEALAQGWLEEMVGWMSIDGVGAVGAKLLYPDNTIQHAGVVVGSHGGLADHIFHRLPQGVIGFNFLTHAARNVSAVTGACMLTSKAMFDTVGGFDQDALGMEYNDVDFCLRLGKAQKRVVFTPQAVLVHHCGQSRGESWRPAEHLNFLRRYRGVEDPYYNENFDLNRAMAVNPGHFLHKGRVGKLKVLMISHNLNLEGAPKVLFDHACYFVSAGGYHVTLVSQQDGPLRRRIEEAGISVEIVEGAVPRRGEITASYQARLRGIGTNLEAKSFDLVVCNTLTSFWGATLAELFDLPVIWHIHESTTLEQFFHFDPVPEGLVQRCLTSADRVVFEANATRQVLSRYQKRDNFETIRGSIDVTAIDRFREQHSQRSMKIKHGLDPDKIVVNLIGTTCPRKGQHVFIEAIKLLQTSWTGDISKICFLMLGARESPYLDLLNSKLKTINGTDTRLIGERDDVFDFYRLTDIFVCPSFQESFPRVILEAMAFKLAIISTDVFGIPEILTNNDEALLVRPGDAQHIARCIGDLVTTPEARLELGARAHAKVTRLFNSSAQLARQLDLTKEVVARHI
jgi:glycosyltransferase involved in cell wall biosynthesis/cellulose synthase/poly-beta-1,6-N-acetylglucosamine synthase-like glycosyltransferase